MSRNSLSVEVHVSEYVDVEVDVEDIISSLDTQGAAKLKAALGIPSGTGDGDAEFTRNTIMRAEMAARRMRDLPREISDMFWHVHGVAI